MGKVVPARAPAPRGMTLVRRRQSSIRSLSLLSISHVGQHVVRKKDRLGGLQVGEARHDHAQVKFRLEKERIDQQIEIGADFHQFVAQIEADIESNLIVAGAPGMEPLAGLADASGEAGLDVHVDVLEGHREIELPRLDLAQYLLQAVDDFFHISPSG